MDLNQIFIKYYPEWTAFEAVVFFSVLIGVTAILLIQVLRKHIRWVQAVSVLLLVTYLMLVFGSTVFMRQPGTRQAEYEWFWSWKVVYHAFEEGYTHSLFWEILLNIALFVPIGALLPLASGRKRGIWLALVTGILISTSIEGLQLWLCRGLFEFDDIFDNTLGCVLGQAVIGNPVTYLLMKISAPPKCPQLFYCSFTYSNGSTTSSFTRISKCRCGPVLFPVLPESPSRSPCATVCPTSTEVSDRCP